MIVFEALKATLKSKFPDLAKEANHLPETAFINVVADAFGVRPQVNPCDFAMYVMGLISDGQAPRDGGGQGSPDAKAQEPGTQGR